jgi:hypothetical protein
MSQLVVLYDSLKQFHKDEILQIKEAFQDHGIAFRIDDQQILVMESKLEQASQLAEEIHSESLHHEAETVALHNMAWAMLRGLFPG